MKLLFCLFLICTSTALADNYSFDLDNGQGHFNVIDDQPGLFLTREGPPGNAVDYREDKFLIHFLSNKKLAFPLDGDKPELLLGEDKGRGTSWIFTPAKGKTYTIQASVGKFKGWYLDIGKEQFKVNYNGKEFHPRKYILVEKPETPRAYEKYVVSK